MGNEAGRSVTILGLKFFVSEYRNLRRGTFPFFTNFLVSKNFIAKRWGRKQGGVSRYSVKNVLSHSTEKLRRGTILCFTKLLVSEKIMDKWGRTEEVSRYNVKFFCLTVPKNFVGEPFCFIQILWYRNSLWKRGGE